MISICLGQEAQNRPEGASVPALGLSNKAVFTGERVPDDRELQPHPNDQYPEVYFTPMTLTGQINLHQNSNVTEKLLNLILKYTVLVPCFISYDFIGNITGVTNNGRFYSTTNLCTYIIITLLYFFSYLLVIHVSLSGSCIFI